MTEDIDAELVELTEDGLIGEKMQMAVRALDDLGPLRMKASLVEVVAPNGSHRYGRPIVDRCLDRDLVVIDEDGVRLTERGERYVELMDEGVVEEFGSYS